MSDQLPVKFDPLQPHEDCWAKVSDFFDLLKRKVYVVLPEGVRAKLWSGNSVPPADKTDWLWFRKTTKGRPVSLFSFHKGEFVPVWPIAPGTPPIMMFNGRVDSVKPPFSVCDGRDGTPDMTEQMIVQDTLVPPVAADFESGTLGDGNLKDEVKLHLGFMQLIGYED